MNLSRFWILAGIVAVALAGGASLHHQQVRDSKKVISISQSGDTIPSLFDGLPHVSSYSLNQIDLMKRNRPEPCKATGASKPKGTSKQSALRRLFGISVVYAQDCFPGQCGGTRWVAVEKSCNTGGGCSGTYEYAQPDPEGDPCDGFAPNNAHCGDDCSCGQSDSICPMC